MKSIGSVTCAGVGGTRWRTSRHQGLEGSSQPLLIERSIVVWPACSENESGEIAIPARVSGERV
jgi:hypothetical protein